MAYYLEHMFDQPHSHSPNTLTSTLDAIHQRWGKEALFQASEVLIAPKLLPTGLADLDALLCGGLPIGHLTELHGGFSSGLTSIMMHMIAATQQAIEFVAYIDLGGVFDASAAQTANLDFEQLIVMQPTSMKQAIDMARELVVSDMVKLIILDVGETQYLPSLRALTASLKQSESVLLLLSRRTTCPSAVLRLHIERQGWQCHYDDISGYISEVQIEKSKWGGVGNTVTLALALDGYPD